MDFAKDFRPIDSLEEVVREIKPTALIGKSGISLLLYNTVVGA